MSGEFARTARSLCTEDHDAPDAPWFCPNCRMLEQRLQPISDVLKDVLADADLTPTINWSDVHDHVYGGDE